jgi:hypothetical protein
MLTAMSAFAQLERDQLAERTKAGTAAAAEHGRKAGRREVTAAHAKVKRGWGIAVRANWSIIPGRKTRHSVDPPNWKYPNSSPLFTWLGAGSCTRRPFVESVSRKTSL